MATLWPPTDRVKPPARRRGGSNLKSAPRERPLVVLWEFHNGIRRPVIRPRDGTLLMTAEDRARWHELKLSVQGADIRGYLDGTQVLQHTLGSAPGPGRNGAAPNPDLFAENNPVLRPPVSGRVGLWSKSDSTSLFKDYVVTKDK